jgi:hypothetical protein
MNDGMPVATRRAAYAELTHHAAAGAIRVDVERFGLDDATTAWQAQGQGPHHELVVVPVSVRRPPRPRPRRRARRPGGGPG